jgi:hypothetical protein
MSGEYTVTQAAVAGLNRGTADTWLQRRYVADVPRIGGGRKGRRLTFLQVVIMTAIADLSRDIRIPVGAAAEFLAHEQISDDFAEAVAAGGAARVLTIGQKNGSPFIRMMKRKEVAGLIDADLQSVLGGGQGLYLLFVDGLVERVRSSLDQPTTSAVSSAASISLA